MSNRQPRMSVKGIQIRIRNKITTVEWSLYAALEKVRRDRHTCTSVTLFNPFIKMASTRGGLRSIRWIDILLRLRTKFAERGFSYLMRVRLRGTACPRPYAERHLRQPYSDNLKYFYSLRVFDIICAWSVMTIIAALAIVMYPWSFFV